MQFINDRKKLVSLFKIIIISIPVVFLFWIGMKYGVNAISNEDMDIIDEFIDIITSGKIDWKRFFAYNNEHIIVFPKIIIFSVAYLTHYNNKMIMFVSLFMLSVIYYIFIKRTVNKKLFAFSSSDIIYALITGFCLFSTVQFENLLWGFQIAWFLIELCAVFGLAALCLYIKTLKTKYIVFALISAFVSSFSSLHGLVIWPCYLSVVIIYQIYNRRFERNLSLFVLVSMVLCYAVYFYDYHEVFPEVKTESFSQMINYMMIIQGSTMLFGNFGIWQTVIGILETLITVCLLFVLWKSDKVRQNLFPLGLIIFSFGMLLVLGIGRAGSNYLFSRYLTFPLLIIVGDLAILRQYLSLDTYRGGVAVICFLLLSELCIYASCDNFDRLKNFCEKEKQRAEILLNYKQASFWDMKHYVYFLMTTREYAINRFGKIEKANLSVFYDKNK